LGYIVVDFTTQPLVLDIPGLCSNSTLPVQVGEEGEVEDQEARCRVQEGEGQIVAGEDGGLPDNFEGDGEVQRHDRQHRNDGGCPSGARVHQEAGRKDGTEGVDEEGAVQAAGDQQEAQAEGQVTGHADALDQGAVP
jgi:hypothetical protein